jgi:large subunit ribosomal protein L23
MARFQIFKKQEKEKKEEILEENHKNQKPEQGSDDLRVIEIFSKLIKKPILTEKAVSLSALNKYIFEVEESLNKSEIKKAIEKKYNVKVKKVNIIKSRKRRKRWLRTYSQPKKYKKAIVTLEEGYKIDLGI